MTPTKDSSTTVPVTRSFSRRRATLLGAALVMGAMALLGEKPILAGGPGDDDGSLNDRIQAQDLVVCYAHGTDTLGVAVSALGGQPLDSTVNLGDPKFAEGLAIYRGCFAKSFSFTLKFGGFTLLTVPDPATRTPATDAALEWANFVNNAFRGPGYQNTQHHMGSILGRVHGTSADVESYLIATHSLGGTAGVDRVGGTYFDHDIKVRGRWLIESRTLDITSSVHIP